VGPNSSSTPGRAGRVAGKVALITGAARGMGAAHARALAREGAAVAIADIAAEPGERLAAELRGASYHDHDVTDATAWKELVANVERAHGPIDVLVNNAGIQVRSAGIEADDEEWAKVTGVNQL